jgi:hypothetical protein
MGLQIAIFFGQILNKQNERFNHALAINGLLQIFFGNAVLKAKQQIILISSIKTDMHGLGHKFLEGLALKVKHNALASRFKVSVVGGDNSFDFVNPCEDARPHPVEQIIRNFFDFGMVHNRN